MERRYRRGVNPRVNLAAIAPSLQTSIYRVTQESLNITRIDSDGDRGTRVTAELPLTRAPDYKTAVEDPVLT